MERNVLIEDANEYIKRAYECAKAHGFHEQKLSIEHCFMLIITEIAEAVDAERNGFYHCNRTLNPQMATVEEWKVVEECKDYEVSNFGRVRSRDMKVWNGKKSYIKNGRVLKPGIGGTGYFTVCLRGRTHKVSRLVANAFLVKKAETDVVNHIDGNKKNDNVGNLEWVSASKNNLHAYDTGLKNPAINKLTYEDKVYIAFQHKMGRAYTSILKDKDFGVTKSAIQRVCNEYKKYTDSVEFELADVCIRIYDTCGAFGVEPIVTDLYDFDNVDMFKKGSFCERCYHLVSIFSLRESESAPLSFVLGMALMFVRYICDKMQIDIVRHIEWKMMYNELRPLRNGKIY